MKYDGRHPFSMVAPDACFGTMVHMRIRNGWAAGWLYLATDMARGSGVFRRVVRLDLKVNP